MFDYEIECIMRNQLAIMEKVSNPGDKDLNERIEKTRAMLKLREIQRSEGRG